MEHGNFGSYEVFIQGKKLKDLKDDDAFLRSERIKLWFSQWELKDKEFRGIISWICKENGM